MYPLLHSLEERGLLVSKRGARRPTVPETLPAPRWLVEGPAAMKKKSPRTLRRTLRGTTRPRSRKASLRRSKLRQEEFSRQRRPILVRHLGADIVHSYTSVLRQRSQCERQFLLQAAGRLFRPQTSQRTA